MRGKETLEVPFPKLPEHPVPPCELMSKLLVSPLISLIVAPYIIPYISPL